MFKPSGRWQTKGYRDSQTGQSSKPSGRWQTERDRKYI